jgi:hypothetical protein
MISSVPPALPTTQRQSKTPIFTPSFSFISNMCCHGGEPGLRRLSSAKSKDGTLLQADGDCSAVPAMTLGDDISVNGDFICEKRVAGAHNHAPLRDAHESASTGGTALTRKSDVKMIRYEDRANEIPPHRLS